MFSEVTLEHRLTVNGEIFPFAKNAVVLPEAHNAAVPAGNYTGSEWAGACPGR